MSEVFAEFAKLVGREFAEKFDKEISESEDIMKVIKLDNAKKICQFVADVITSPKAEARITNSVVPKWASDIAWKGHRKIYGKDTNKEPFVDYRWIDNRGHHQFKCAMIPTTGEKIMIIVYIEEDQAAAINRLHTLKRSFDPVTFVAAEPLTRRIKLVSGLNFYVITKDELDKIRELSALAVFINCDLDAYDRAGVASIVRVL